MQKPIRGWNHLLRNYLKALWNNKVFSLLVLLCPDTSWHIRHSKCLINQGISQRRSRAPLCGSCSPPAWLGQQSPCPPAVPTLCHSFLFSDCQPVQDRLFQNGFPSPPALYPPHLKLLTSTFALKRACSHSLSAFTYQLSETAGAAQHCSLLAQWNLGWVNAPIVGSPGEITESSEHQTGLLDFTVMPTSCHCYHKLRLGVTQDYLRAGRAALGALNWKVKDCEREIPITKINCGLDGIGLQSPWYAGEILHGACPCSNNFQDSGVIQRSYFCVKLEKL